MQKDKLIMDFFAVSHPRLALYWKYLLHFWSVLPSITSVVERNAFLLLLVKIIDGQYLVFIFILAFKLMFRAFLSWSYAASNNFCENIQNYIFFLTVSLKWYSQVPHYSFYFRKLIYQQVWKETAHCTLWC